MCLFMAFCQYSESFRPKGKIVRRGCSSQDDTYTRLKSSRKDNHTLCVCALPPWNILILKSKNRSSLSIISFSAHVYAPHGVLRLLDQIFIVLNCTTRFTY